MTSNNNQQLLGLLRAVEKDLLFLQEHSHHELAWRARENTFFSMTEMLEKNRCEVVAGFLALVDDDLSKIVSARAPERIFITRIRDNLKECLSILLSDT